MDNFEPARNKQGLSRLTFEQHYCNTYVFEVKGAWKDTWQQIEVKTYSAEDERKLLEQLGYTDRKTVVDKEGFFIYEKNPTSIEEFLKGIKENCIYLAVVVPTEDGKGWKILSETIRFWKVV